MSDYESSWFIGALSAVIIFFLMTVLFWALSPAWYGYVSGITNVVIGSGLSAIAPQLGAVINNLTFSITVVFFALIATPLVYLLVLPFLRVINNG